MEDAEGADALCARELADRESVIEANANVHGRVRPSLSELALSAFRAELLHLSRV
jgi:hypothetical protein